MDANIEDRVAAGAEWLDKNNPNWAERIDLDEFYFGACTTCVLGLLYDDFCIAVGSRASSLMTLTQAKERGFEGNSRADYPECQKAWRREIRNRKGA